MKRALITILLLISLSAVFAGAKKPKAKPRPAWLDDPYIEFNQKEYLCAVGAAFTQTGAEAEARTRLEGQIEARLLPSAAPQASFQDLLQEGTAPWSVAEEDGTTPLQISEVLAQLDITTPNLWKDEQGRFHALACLNRTEAARLIKERIDSLNQRILEKFSQVAQTDDPWRQYALIAAAGKADVHNQEYRAALQIIDQAEWFALRPAYDSEILRYQVAEAARKLAISVTAYGEGQDPIRAELISCLAELGFSLKDKAGFQVIADLQLGTNTGSQEQSGSAYSFNISLFDAEGNRLLHYMAAATAEDSPASPETAIAESRDKVRSGFLPLLLNWLEDLAQDGGDGDG